MHRFTSHIALSALIAFTAAGTPCLADETPATQPVAATSTTSDLKVARDKETGKLRAATAEESAALGAKARTLAPSIVEIRRPFSTVERRSDGSMVGKRSLADMDSLMLETTPDGKTVMRHSSEVSQEAPAVTAELPTE